MLNNGRPYHLPQIHAPLTEVFKKLNEEGVEFEVIQTDPNTLQPTQKFVFADEISNCIPSESNPIWLSSENQVVDGHHRWINSINSKTPIFAVKLNLNHNDACRILNKIQDIYDYSENLKMEDVGNDYINDYNSNNNDEKNEFLSSLEIDNSNIEEDSEKEPSKPEVVVAYRKEPIKDNSIIGNFFSLKPIEGYDKYEIEFDNLLDTNHLGITYKSGQVPIDVLSKAWFPHINFEKLAKEYNTDVTNLKNKAIAHKAMQQGFDGIKYGDNLIQGLK